jgi:signal recognition particle subunit SRP72
VCPLALSHATRQGAKQTRAEQPDHRAAAVGAQTAAHAAARTPLPTQPQNQKKTVLALLPDDADALAAKAVAHLELGEFDAASAALSATPLADDQEWALERAYALYRRGLLKEALSALGGDRISVPEDRLSAALQLRAQLHYRLGDAQSCVADYEALLLPSGGQPALTKHADTQAQLLEIKTNAVAAHVAAGLSAQVPQLMTALKLSSGRNAPSFEAEYNRACALVAEGDLAAAEAALKHALRTGEEALYAEDLAEEEVLDELAPLAAQLAYVAARSGRPGEALERLEPLVAGELSDAATAAVAAVNHAACTLAALAAASSEGDSSSAVSAAPSFADPAAAKSAAAKALKRLENAISDKAAASSAAAASAGVLAIRPDLASRLSPEQQRAVHLSRALLMGLAGRVDQAREVASALAKQQQQQQQAGGSNRDARVSLLLAALLARAGKTAEAEAALASLGGSDDAMEVEDGSATIDASAPVLLRAQLAAEAGHAARAASLLSELPGGSAAAFSPGVLATRVALLERAGEASDAEALLEQGLEHWQQRAAAGGGKASSSSPSDAAAGVGWCLQRLVALKLAAGKTPEAMRLFQQLMAGGGAKGGKGSSAAAAVAAGAAGASVVARLARAAAASGDAASIAQLARQLPGGSAAGTGAGLDTDALEDVTRVLGARARRAAAKGDEAGGAAGGGGGEEGGEAGEAAVAAAAPSAAAARKRARRKRKPRYPAGYDASKGPGGGLPTPDPERWLPKWQRSNFKKQQRRRNRDARDRVVGSQGAGKVDEALDRTKAGGSTAAVEEAPSARPSLPPRKGRPRK